MSVFKRGDKWVSKFQHAGAQQWTPGGPWKTKRNAQEAERRYRDQLDARVSEETCASFAERWLEEWPRPEASTQRLYAAAARRFAEHFGPTPLGGVERLSARSWALSVPRSVSRVIGTMYEDARNIGVVESNPFSGLRLPRRREERDHRAPDDGGIPGPPRSLHSPRRLRPGVQVDDSVRGLDGHPAGRAIRPPMGRRQRGRNHRQAVPQARRLARTA